MGLVVHQIEFKVRKLRVQLSTPPPLPLQPYLYIWQKVTVTFNTLLSHLIKSKAPAFEASAGTLAEQIK